LLGLPGSLQEEAYTDKESGILLRDSNKQSYANGKSSIAKIEFSLALAELLTRWEGTVNQEEWSYALAVKAVTKGRFHRQHLSPELFTAHMKDGVASRVTFNWRMASGKAASVWHRSREEIRLGAGERQTHEVHRHLYPKTYLEGLASSGAGQRARRRIDRGEAASAFNHSDSGSGSGDEQSAASAARDAANLAREEKRKCSAKITVMIKELLESIQAGPDGDALARLIGDSANAASDAAVRAALAAIRLDQYDWTWLEQHPSMVPELTMFDTWDEINSFALWMDECNLLSNMRLLTSKVRASKAAHDGPSGTTPGRKRPLRPRTEKRALSGFDAFFLVNFVLR
jgi:hypothetical protein